MYCIRQTELFSFEQLLEMKPEDKYNEILKHLDLTSVLLKLSKTSNLGRPQSLNYAAMVYSLLLAKMERMEFVKDIVRRLRSSLEFQIQCRFTGSDSVPSEASYTRLIKALHEKKLIESSREQLVFNAIQEGFLPGIHLAFDSSAVEAWDCQYTDAASKRRAHRNKGKQPTPDVEQIELGIAEPAPLEAKQAIEKPKYKRGRPSKEEAERRKEEQEAYEASLRPFEKSIAGMVPHSLEELMEDMPTSPSTCAKKNSKGRMTSWYGYKANMLVDADSEYPVVTVYSSAHLNDQRMAVVLLKKLAHQWPQLQPKHILGDKGYDSRPIYEMIHALGAYPLIDIIQHTDPPEGLDTDFRPVCQQGHAYRYDSFDQRYQTLKYIHPKECNGCPLGGTGCQKVFKIKLDKDFRQYTYPARGSETYKELFKKRTAIERVFAYLKEYFGLGRTRHRGKKAFVDFELSTLAFTISKFALDKMNQQISSSREAA